MLSIGGRRYEVLAALRDEGTSAQVWESILIGMFPREFMGMASMDRKRMFPGMVSLALLILVGCGDPMFREKWAVRDERIKAYFSDFLRREASSSENLAKLRAYDKNAWRRHGEQLKETRRRIYERQMRDFREWREEEPQRNARINRIFEGNLESIPSTVRDMVP